MVEQRLEKNNYFNYRHCIAEQRYQNVDSHKFHFRCYKFSDYADIGYNWLIGEDGRIYEGRGWTAVGAHTRGYNSQAVAVSVMGTFTSRIPNADALDAIDDIIDCGVRNVCILKINL